MCFRKTHVLDPAYLLNIEVRSLCCVQLVGSETFVCSARSRMQPSNFRVYFVPRGLSLQQLSRQMSLGMLVRHCRLRFLLPLCPVTSRRAPGLPTRGLSRSAPVRLQRNRPATPSPPSRAGVVPTSAARATTNKASAGCRACGRGAGAALRPAWPRSAGGGWHCSSLVGGFAS